MSIHKSPTNCKPSLWKTGIKRTILSRPARWLLSDKTTQCIINRFKLWEA